MKNKTGKSKPNKKILVLAISLTLALLMSAGTVTYAIFTNSNHAQRTIAPYESVVGDAFSSNNLLKGNSENNIKTIFVTDNLTIPSVHVTVCNYDQGKQSLPNAKDIYYKLTARLVYLDSGDYVPVTASYMTTNSLTGYTVTVALGDGSPVTLGSSTELSHVFTSSLDRGVAHSDSYTVRFNGGFVEHQPNLYLEMVATPYTDNNYTDIDITLPALSGIFKTGMGAQTSWTGLFNDDQGVEQSPIDPSDYDGYNYVVSGFGRGTFTLKWNNSKLILSDESIRTLGVTPTTDGTTSTITFSVNSDNVSRYDLQFYRKNIDAEEWEDMNSVLENGNLSTVVGYSFAESE